MADSFFDLENAYDAPFRMLSRGDVLDLMSAGTRRLAKIDGPIEASIRLQKYADLCAAKHVLPIEHWRALDAKAAAEDAPKPWHRRLGDRLASFSAWSYWLGFFIAWFIKSLVG